MPVCDFIPADVISRNVQRISISLWRLSIIVYTLCDKKVPWLSRKLGQHSKVKQEFRPVIFFQVPQPPKIIWQSCEGSVSEVIHHCVRLSCSLSEWLTIGETWNNTKILRSLILPALWLQKESKECEMNLNFSVFFSGYCHKELQKYQYIKYSYFNLSYWDRRNTFISYQKRNNNIITLSYVTEMEILSF